MAYYKGSEIKFAVNITAAGFDMDTDDWELKVVNGRTEFAIAKEDCTKVEPEVTEPAEPGEETPAANEEAVWYAICDTKDLAVGDLYVISTAYVPDAAAKDGVRTDIDKQKLCKLELP